MLTTARNAAPETVTVRLPLLHTGQRKALNRWQKARFLVQPCGRGFGKSTGRSGTMAHPISAASARCTARSNSGSAN
jgi:hypothetical protein